MPSRKRSWSGPESSTINQKRKCSNLSYGSPPILTRHVAPSMHFTRSRLPKVLHSNVPQICIHKRLNVCILSLDVCCACADKRPHSSTYPLYADGFGTVRSTCRSTHYCSGCKDSDSVRETPSTLAVQPISDTGVIVTCADRAFNFVRSYDLTLEELQRTVALIMQCDPYSLEVLATDVDLERSTDAPGRGLVDVLSYASRIHFRITEAGEDVEMEEAPAFEYQ